MAVGGDHSPIALHNSPIDPAVRIPSEVPRRYAIELRSADVRAYRVDERVPRPLRLEEAFGCNIGLLLGKRIEALMKFPLCLEKGELLRERKSDRSRRSHPRRRRFVDRAALRLSRAAPRIAVGGVQPTAAEIDGTCRVLGGRPRPSAKPRPRLKQETLDPRVGDPPRRGNTSRAAADDYHLSIAAVGHALSAALGMEEGIC